MTNNNRYLIIAYYPTAKKALLHAQELKRWEISSKKINLIAIEYISADQEGKLKVYRIRSRASSPTALVGGQEAQQKPTGVGGTSAAHVSSSVSAALFRKQTGMDPEDRKHFLQHLADGYTALIVLADGVSANVSIAKLAAEGARVDTYRVPIQSFDAMLARAVEVRKKEAFGDPLDWNIPQVEIINKTIIHYHRHNSDYKGWGIHVWTGCDHQVSWQEPIQPSGFDSFGAVFDIPLAAGDSGLSYIIHNGDEKDLWDDQFLDFDKDGHEVWIIQNTPGYLPAPAPNDEN